MPLIPDVLIHQAHPNNLRSTYRFRRSQIINWYFEKRYSLPRTWEEVYFDLIVSNDGFHYYQGEFYTKIVLKRSIKHPLHFLESTHTRRSVTDYFLKRIFTYLLHTCQFFTGLLPSIVESINHKKPWPEPFKVVEEVKKIARFSYSLKPIWRNKPWRPERNGIVHLCLMPRNIFRIATKSRAHKLWETFHRKRWFIIAAG